MKGSYSFMRLHDKVETGSSVHKASASVKKMKGKSYHNVFLPLWKKIT